MEEHFLKQFLKRDPNFNESESQQPDYNVERTLYNFSMYLLLWR